MKCITKLEDLTVPINIVTYRSLYHKQYEFMKYNMVEQLSDPDPAKWGVYITDKFSNALSKGRQAA